MPSVTRLDTNLNVKVVNVRILIGNSNKRFTQIIIDIQVLKRDGSLLQKQVPLLKRL